MDESMNLFFIIFTAVLLKFGPFGLIREIIYDRMNIPDDNRKKLLLEKLTLFFISKAHHFPGENPPNRKKIRYYSLTSNTFLFFSFLIISIFQ